MGEPAASPLLSSPTTPTTTRARKQPRQALSEADIPALPPADASQEEKARIMKENAGESRSASESSSATDRRASDHQLRRTALDVPRTERRRWR